MVSRVLEKEQIEAGRDLLERLERVGSSPKAALWLYRPESDEWRLVLTDQKVEEEGPRSAYERLQEILFELPETSRIPLHHVTLLSPNAPLIQLLRRAIQTGPGISGIRFTNNAINGTVIEDAYIYRVT